MRDDDSKEVKERVMRSRGLRPMEDIRDILAESRRARMLFWRDLVVFSALMVACAYLVWITN